jgi:hypothetical protein
MTQWFVIIGFLALPWGSTALAQEPTGFAGFAWGTPRIVVDNEFVKKRCPWHTTYPTLRGHQRIACSDYDMSPVGTVYLTLDFVGDVLTGYQVAVPRGSARRCEPQFRPSSQRRRQRSQERAVGFGRRA